MIVVIDLEHTITNSSDRLWLLKYKGGSEALDKMYNRQFQEAFVDDYLNMNIKLFMDALAKKGHTVVILTAKLETYRKIVIEWLKIHEVKYDVLIMKKDFTISDLDFKENYAKLNEKNIAFALDDVGNNCAMFAKYNIPCLRIEQK